MISKVYARGFRGLDFDQDLGQYNIFCGLNGSGKSARSHALTLTLLGYLPSDQAKQPGAIHATHGTPGEIMEVAVEINGDRLARKYTPKEEGVSLQVSLNGKKLNQKEFSRVMIDLGDPRIFDLREFNDLSDQKKIDTLLTLFPPSGDIKKLERDSAKCDEEINSLQNTQIRGAQKVIERLTAERAALDLSEAGTLAEVQAEIAAKEGELGKVEAEIKEEEAKAREEKARQEAEERARIEAARKEREGVEAKARQERDMEAARQRARDALESARKAQVELDALKKHQEEKLRSPDPATAPRLSGLVDATNDCLGSLERIKATLEEAGCSICAALIVVKGEMKRFKT